MSEEKQIGMIEDSLVIDTPKGRKRVVAESDQNKRVKIILEENENIPPTGQFFGVNGTGYLLRAGETAEVPEALIDVLDNAVEEVPVVDPVTKQPIGHRPKHRFAYRVVR
jgi:hypothetical protein